MIQYLSLDPSTRPLTKFIPIVSVLSYPFAGNPFTGKVWITALPLDLTR